MLSGKSVGILCSPTLKQSTLTPSEVSVQKQPRGHDDTTPTSEITTAIAVIRNCMLRRKSTNTEKECIYLVIICHCCFACINKM